MSAPWDTSAPLSTGDKIGITLGKALGQFGGLLIAWWVWNHVLVDVVAHPRAVTLREAILIWYGFCLFFYPTPKTWPWERK